MRLNFIKFSRLNVILNSNFAAHRWRYKHGFFHHTHCLPDRCLRESSHWSFILFQCLRGESENWVHGLCLHVFIVELDGWVKIGAISLYEFTAQWEEWLQHGCATLIGTSFIWKITTISQKEEGEIPSKSLKGQKLNIHFTPHLRYFTLFNENATKTTIIHELGKTNEILLIFNANWPYSVGTLNLFKFTQQWFLVPLILTSAGVYSGALRVVNK